MGAVVCGFAAEIVGRGVMYARQKYSHMQQEYGKRWRNYGGWDGAGHATPAWPSRITNLSKSGNVQA
jgi:hypothetical protein